MYSQSGLFFALVTILLWGVNIVMSRHVIVNLHANPYMFSTLMMLTCSVVLLMIAREKPKLDETLKHPMTWIYSSLQILLNIASLIALIYLTSTQSMLLQRINIVLGFAVSAMFLSKTISKNDILGSFLIIGGVGLLLSSLDFKDGSIAFAAVCFAAVCHVLRTTIAEHHPVANRAKNFREYCKVLGYIMFLTSTIFLIGGLSISYVGSSFGVVPEISEMITIEQAAFALGMGTFILPIAMYSFFYGAKLAGMSNFLVYTAFLPLVTLVFEVIADKLNILSMPQITLIDIISATAIMFGALYIAYSRRKLSKSLAS